MKGNFFLASLSLIVSIQVCILNLAAQASPKQVTAQKVTKISNLEYVPPTGRIQREQRSKSSVIRCGTDPEGVINLLAPDDHVANTVSGHPTFFWYVEPSDIEQPYLVSFTLIQSEAIEPIIEAKLRVNQSGLVQFKTPSNIPQLEMGKEYQWTVSLVRNAQHPSQNPYAYAWLKRVPLLPLLKQKLATVRGNFERSSVYANSGLWYDTLSTIYRVSSNEKKFQPQQLIEQIKSGKSMWLVNQLPVASYASASKDDLRIVRGTGCH